MSSSQPRERNSVKYDAELAMPFEDGEPTPAGSVPSEPYMLVLERIPTYLQPSLPWRDRLLHFTFAWYTVTCVCLCLFCPFPTLTSPLFEPNFYLG